MNRWWETFTPKQGQYLVVIHMYTRLHRRPLAETNMQEYFRVSPTLGFHPKTTKDPRSIVLLVDPKQLPELL